MRTSFLGATILIALSVWSLASIGWASRSRWSQLRAWLGLGQGPSLSERIEAIVIEAHQILQAENNRASAEQDEPRTDKSCAELSQSS